MPNKLVNINIKEVSGVDRAANMRKFLLIKRADPLDKGGTQIEKGGETVAEENKIRKFFDICKNFFTGGESTAQDLDSVLAENQNREDLSELIWALRDSIDSIVDDDTAQDKTTAVATSLTQFLQALKDKQVIKAGKKISTTRLQALKDAHKAIGDVIAEADDSASATGNAVNKKRGDDNVPISEDVRKNLSKEVQEYLADVEKKAGQVDGLTSKVEGLEKKLGEEAGSQHAEDIWKGVNPEVRKHMEGLQKQLNDTKTELAKAQSEQKSKEYITKAAGLDALPIKADELGLVMKALAEKDPENFAKLEGVLTAANEAVKKGALFSEAGRGGAKTGGSVEKMNAKVAEMITKDASMTKEKAFTKVMHDNPELYAEYLAERGER